MTTTYTVRGMTCGHCVNAVTEDLLSIMGVTDVDIDLVEGGDSTVRVTSTDPLDPTRVRVAIDEAGYELLT
ncbi:MAG: heavy-metal-associated domain-containing protein [Candidatus Nanopelagicales bacterium]